MLRVFHGDDSSQPEPSPPSQLFSDYLDWRLTQPRQLAPRSIAEYRTTQRKLAEWECAHRSTRPMRFGMVKEEVSGFLAFVLQTAIDRCVDNPGRVHNKAHGHLKTVLEWASKRMHFAMPEMPVKQEAVSSAGTAYLSDAEIGRLYQSTDLLPVPRNWPAGPAAFGDYWRAALVLFYNLGLDTQSLFPFWRPRSVIRRQDVSFVPGYPPSRRFKIESPYGWMFWKRAKSGKLFERPLNEAMANHLRVIIANQPADCPLFCQRSAIGQDISAGGSRPNERFQALCGLADIEPKVDFVTREPVPWNLKDLRKTAATAAEMNQLKQSAAQQLLGHSDSRITYGHYVTGELGTCMRILAAPQPAAFLQTSLGRGGLSQL